MQTNACQTPPVSSAACANCPSLSITPNILMKPSAVPSSPSNGAICAMVASMFNFSSKRGTSCSPVSSSASRTPSRPRSRLRMAFFTSRATGPGVASQMESASTTLSRLSTVRTPARNSAELICARWKWSTRSTNTAMATALRSSSSHTTGPPAESNVGSMGFL